MNAVRKIIALFILCVCCQAETTLYLPLIPGFVQNDQQGLYDKAWSELAKHPDISIRIQRLPYARAIGIFASEKDSCLGIGSVATAQLYLELEVIESDAYFFKNEMIIGSLKQQGPLIQSEQELHGLSGVVLAPDSDLVTERFGSVMQLYVVESFAQAMKMLDAERAQVLFGNTGDLIPYQTRLQYDPGMNLYESTEHFICHPGAGKDQLVKDVSVSLQELQASDRWVQYLNSLYEAD